MVELQEDVLHHALGDGCGGAVLGATAGVAVAAAAKVLGYEGDIDLADAFAAKAEAGTR